MKDAPIPCELVDWPHFYALARTLAHKIRESAFSPDLLVAIGRGGYAPGRILSDLLGIMDLTSFKIEHYRGTARVSEARVRYPLSAPVSGRRILLVDDVSDTGETFQAAIAHLLGQGDPAELRTAAIDHKVISTYQPHYHARSVEGWRWIIYPWAVVEDTGSFIAAMVPRLSEPEEIAARIERDHRVRIPVDSIRDALALLDLE